eukprot:NODE_2714_length_1357_cov_74.846840_g2578_i0.p1 GENE.NODE_2714_length_1357_cov_74.846840_g2578_i0~~NODE_2714_length_1357_cov_74.846840_g2578_i0.p1  ORF type:complete len:400 (-),score=84.50 NODE_2714_length_1357_cov_74.846840_g2578_i0:68-1267(-)
MSVFINGHPVGKPAGTRVSPLQVSTLFGQLFNWKAPDGSIPFPEDDGGLILQEGNYVLPGSEQASIQPPLPASSQAPTGIEPPPQIQAPPQIQQQPMQPPPQMQAPPPQMQGPPQMMQGPPQMMQGPPQMMQGPPQMMQGLPQMMQGPPQMMQGPPQMQPRPMQGQSLQPTTGYVLRNRQQPPAQNLNYMAPNQGSLSLGGVPVVPAGGVPPPFQQQQGWGGPQAMMGQGAMQQQGQQQAQSAYQQGNPGRPPMASSQKPKPLNGMKDNDTKWSPGDWLCEQCGNHNFSNRTKCSFRKCSAAKPANVADGQRQFVNLVKKKLCANFSGGGCKYGDGCSFAHGPEEIGKPIPEGARVFVERKGPKGGDQQDQQQQDQWGGSAQNSGGGMQQQQMGRYAPY